MYMMFGSTPPRNATGTCEISKGVAVTVRESGKKSAATTRVAGFTCCPNEPETLCLEALYVVFMAVSIMSKVYALLKGTAQI
jgi:hypothetical protein